MGLKDWFRPNKPVSAPPSREPGPRQMMVELLFDRRPSLEREAILASVRRRRPQAALGSATDHTLLLLHPDHPIGPPGQTIPAQTWVLGASRESDGASPAMAAALSQTWDCDHLKTVAPRCRHSLMVTEMLSTTLAPLARLEIFLGTLAGAVEALQPQALLWFSSSKLADPAELLKLVDGPRVPRRLAAALNVRLFNIANGADGEIVMDSLGLSTLGLPDVQVHATGLDPGRLAAHLYNCALYLLEQGDVVQDGHTIGGLAPDQKWRCQHEDALIGPDRVVLDLDPGPPYAAGNRSPPRPAHE